MSRQTGARTSAPEVADAVRSTKRWFLVIGVFSAGINILMLTGAIYMLQLYDRVLLSRSVDTLLALSLLAAIAYAVQGLLESIRSRMLVHLGVAYELALSPSAFAAASALALRGANNAQALQPVRDLERVRGFLAGGGPIAVLDMPFMPIFLAGCFLLHPWLGWLAVAGGVLIIAMTVTLEVVSRKTAKSAMLLAQKRNALLEASCRNAEAMLAMGFRKNLRERWFDVSRSALSETVSTGNFHAALKSWVKVLRLALQSVMIGLGGYLAIHDVVSSGAIVAASIMMSRALAPIELAIGHWRNFVATRESHNRLKTLMAAGDFGRGKTSLPAPCASLTVDNVVVCAPGDERRIVKGISFTLKAGSALALFGPSAAGKSTLARAIVGVWPPMIGEVRLDGAAIAQYPEDDIGRFIGYLPQDVELFDGTVGENISRFYPDAPNAEIVDAAIKAGAHEVILQLPKGYDTRIGDSGTKLSGGQRQRIALARALFRDPFLVVLDEPNSNLDGKGDQALNEAIASVRRRNGIVIIITHRTAMIRAVDHIAVLYDGRLEEFGRTEEILPKLVDTSRSEVTGRARGNDERGRSSTPQAAG